MECFLSSPPGSFCFFRLKKTHFKNLFFSFYTNLQTNNHPNFLSLFLLDTRNEEEEDGERRRESEEEGGKSCAKEAKKRTRSGFFFSLLSFHFFFRKR